jgi:hypothetical protein
MSPLQCAEAIRRRLERGLDDATAIRRLAALPP